MEKEAEPIHNFCYESSTMKYNNGSNLTYDIKIETPNAKKYIVVEEYDIGKISKISPANR